MTNYQVARWVIFDLLIGWFCHLLFNFITSTILTTLIISPTTIYQPSSHLPSSSSQIRFLSGYTIDNLFQASYDLVKEALARFDWIDRLIEDDDGWLILWCVWLVLFEKMYGGGWLIRRYKKSLKLISFLNIINLEDHQIMWHVKWLI